MKKLCALLLSVLLVSGCLPVTVSAASAGPPWEDCIQYPLNGGYLMFDTEDGSIETAVNLTGDVVIPREINGVKVERLDEFSNNSEITSLTLNEGMEEIRASFVNCPGLKIIVLSSTVREIAPYIMNENTPAKIEVAPGNPYFTADKDGVLYNLDQTVLVRCPTSLTRYQIPEGVLELGNESFYQCGQLKTVTLPDSLRKIGRSGFSNCASLEKLYLPAGVTEIAPNSLWGLNADITVEEENPAFRSDDQHALYTKDGLTLRRAPGSIRTFAVPEGVETISEGAFSESSLVKIVFSDSLREIGDGAFWGCSDLVSVNFAEGLESVGERAFHMCESLKEVHLPDSLRILKTCAFDMCPSLKALVLPGNLNPPAEYASVWKIGFDLLVYVPKGSETERQAIEHRWQYRTGLPEDYAPDLPPPMPGTPFVDVPGYDESAEFIYLAFRDGLVAGVSPIRFDPGGGTTRGMLVTVLHRLTGKPAPETASGFSDVKPGAYYGDAVAWARENGMISGFQGKFDPGRMVSREETASVVYRYLTRKYAGDFEFSPRPYGFADSEKVSPWAKEAVNAMLYSGVTWLEDGSFRPQARLTREELCLLLANIRSEVWIPVP